MHGVEVRQDPATRATDSARSQTNVHPLLMSVRKLDRRRLDTDHGAAARCSWWAVACATACTARAHLGDLTDGDVRVTTDCRAIYGAVLQRLGIAAEPVLGKSPAAIALFR